jgi:hypothetical protein
VTWPFCGVASLRKATRGEPGQAADARCAASWTCDNSAPAATSSSTADGDDSARAPLPEGPAPAPGSACAAAKNPAARNDSTSASAGGPCSSPMRMTCFIKNRES